MSGHKDSAGHARRRSRPSVRFRLRCVTTFRYKTSRSGILRSMRCRPWTPISAMSDRLPCFRVKTEWRPKVG